MNIYVKLTQEFNRHKMSAILSSGQAVVLHRLAIMSKDGDWIIREEEEALTHILSVLSEHKAHYRFGAPLDLRWMRGGWSSHFEFYDNAFRVRTDFVTRPPRLTHADITALWHEQQGSSCPVVDVRRLAELKKTNREKDYAVIGELARLLTDPQEQALLSRSARDLIELNSRNPDIILALMPKREVLRSVNDGEQALEKALDTERRELMHANEARLQRYIESAEEWVAAWPDISAKISKMPLNEAHAVVVNRAEKTLPFHPAEARS